MPNITVHPELNPLEVLLVEDYMAANHPLTTAYTMTRGNDCIWVYYSYMNLYFIFRNGRIADVQID